MKEKQIVSTVTLLSSLAGYFYARHADRDPVPIVMVSGFFGAFLGETIFKMFSQGDDRDDNDKNPPPPMIPI